MMYVVFIVDHIHHLINESNMLIFAFNSDRRVYLLGTSILPPSLNIGVFCKNYGD